MKKILALLLIFAMSATLCLTPVWAEEEAGEAVPVITEDAVDLAALGIIESPEVLDANKTLTRGEFAVILANALGGVKESASTYFADVTEEHPSYKAVSVLAEEGIIHGGDNGLFLPDGEMTFAAALKMVICALGYNDLASARGGYPTGYTSVGSALKLPKGNGVLKGGAAAELIWEALKTETASVSGVSDSGSLSYTGSGETLMESRLNIIEIKGQLTENCATALTGESSLESGYALIGGEMFEISDSLATEYIGFNVIAYAEDKEPHRVVKTVKINDSRSTVKEVSSEDINEGATTKTALAYYNGDNSYLYKISAYADVIYNGQALQTSYTKSDFCPSSGKVVLIDNDRDGTYDVVKVTSYENVLVGFSVTENTERFSDKNDETISFGINSKENIVSVVNGSDNSPGNVTDLIENTLVSVAQAKDMGYSNRYIRIVINEEVISGTITSKGNDVVYIDGTKFEVADDYRGDALTAGYSASFYLDINGRIAASAVNADGELRYGMIFAAVEEGGGMDKKVSVKILTTANEYEIFNLSDGFKLNGAKTESLGELTGALKNTRYLPYKYADKVEATPSLAYRDNEYKQLIKYKVNEAGEVTRMYTADGSEENEEILTKDFPIDVRSSKRDNSSWGTKYLEFFDNGSTLFLLFPNGNAPYETRQEEKQYSLVKGRGLAGSIVDTGGGNYVEAYCVDDGGYAGVILKEEVAGTLPEIGGGVRGALFEGTEEVYKDGEIYTNLIVWKKGAGSSVTLSNELQDSVKAVYEQLEPGDMISYSTNRFGEIENIELDLDCSEHNWNGFTEAVGTGSRGGTYQQQNRTFIGAIYKVHKSSTMISTPNVDKLIAGDYDSLILEYTALGKLGGATVFNRKTKEVRRCNLTEVAAYSYFSDPNARVVFKTDMGIVTDLFIYE